MKIEDVEALFTRVNEEPVLQARFKAVADEAEFDALISELGYELTYADFAEVAQDVELSEDDLANVAGGNVSGGELATFAAGVGAVIISGANIVTLGGLGTAVGFIDGTRRVSGW